MRHTRRAPFWIGALATCTLLACAGVASAQPDDAQSARDANTMTPPRVVIAPQAHAAEGQVSLRLVMPGGAGHDPIGASGLAHIVSHALWDSAMDRLEARASGGDERARSLLASMGGRQHAHRGATVDMRATTYRVDLAGASDETISDALSLLGDIRAGHALRDRDRLSGALTRVREELRGWTSPYLRVNQRATRALFEPLGLAPGPFVGRLDDLADLDALALADLAYAAHWGGGAPTVIVAGDTDALTQERLRTSVLDVIPPPASVPLRFQNHLTTPTTPDAVIIRDPEITFGVVELLRIDQASGPSSNPWIGVPGDEASMRESILRAAAAEALRRRLELATGSMTGDDALSEVIVMSKPFSPGVWLNVVHAMNAPGRWDHALGVLAGEIRRVETHGYTDGEARLALSRALREFESGARRENAETGAEAADRIADLLRLGEPVRTPSERLLAARASIAGVGASELREATVRAFGLGKGIVPLAATHDSETRADEGALLKILTTVHAATPDALPASLAEPASAESLLARAAGEGRAMELRADPASGVFTATLTNNLVIHHRDGAPGSGSVVIEISVAGGEIDEKAGVPRGITDAAISAWRDAATATLTSREVRDAISGADLRVRAWADHDVVRLSLRVTREDLETALGLASALLREPRVEPAALERWKQTALERASLARTQPFDALRHAMWAPGVDADDPRVRAPGENDLRAITHDLAQGWLDDLLANGSVEVALVGDVPRADALRLASSLLGSIPVRPVIESVAIRPDAPTRGSAPMTADIELDTLSPHAAALVGFVTDAGADAFSWASMDLASRVLSPRVREALGAELSIANEARSMFMPVEGWRGLSLCYTPMLASPDRIERVADAAQRVYATVAASGVSEDELSVARAASLRAMDAELLDPGAWARTLSVATRRGHPVDLPLRRRDAIATVDAGSVQREIADRLEGGDAVRVIVRPAGR